MSSKENLAGSEMNVDKIQTFIFMDFETGPTYAKGNGQTSKFGEVKRDLNSMVMSNMELVPHKKITELAMVALPRLLFEQEMNNLWDKRNEKGPIEVRCMANINVRQTNIDCTDEEWDQYEGDRTRYNKAWITRFELQQKDDLKSEWPEVAAFLKKVKKPAIILAHNGCRFDFPILACELRRHGLLENHDIPELYFHDTKIIFQDLEHGLLKEIELNINQKRLNKRDILEIHHGGKLPQKQLSDPNCYMEKKRWPLAFRRRIGSGHVTISQYGYRFELARYWDHMLGPYVNDYQRKKVRSGNFSLDKMHDQIIGTKYNAHRAQPDAEAMARVCIAYGEKFLTYVDKHKAPMKFILPLPVDTLIPNENQIKTELFDTPPDSCDSNTSPSLQRMPMSIRVMNESTPKHSAEIPAHDIQPDTVDGDIQSNTPEDTITPSLNHSYGNGAYRNLTQVFNCFDAQPENTVHGTNATEVVNQTI